MSFEVKVKEQPGYLQIDSTGDFSLPALFEFIDRVKEEAVKSGHHRILVNSLEIKGELSEADRFRAGQKTAEVFGSRFRVAVLMPAGKITKMAELAASNRGANLLMTDSENEAREWLFHE